MAQVTFNITARPPFWFRPTLAVMAFISRMGYTFSNETIERFCDRAAHGVKLYSVESTGKRKRIKG